MLILGTSAHETIWGGARLLPYTQEPVKKIGHLYSLCYEKGMETRILNGSYKGKLFQQYFEENKVRFGLDMYEEFPFILALVEAAENLSIQVHPNDAVAKETENAAFGKNESWYFIDIPESGEIFDGCLANHADEVKAVLSSGQMMSLVDRLTVQPGDYVYVEAGTLHAMTAGSLVYEIEENSPWTYRMYDYDRRDAAGNLRELHIEQGIKALDVDLKSSSVPMGDGWISERKYNLLKLSDVRSYRNTGRTLQCFTLISGGCEIDGIRINMGTTVVLEPGETITGDFALAMVAEPR